jgi:hypothetical protein
MRTEAAGVAVSRLFFAMERNVWEIVRKEDGTFDMFQQG